MVPEEHPNGEASADKNVEAEVDLLKHQPAETSPKSSSGSTTTLMPFSSLSAEQKERLSKAKAYAKEQTAILLASRPKITAVTPAAISGHALAALNYHMQAGPMLEARTLATMSRIYVGSISFELTDVHVREFFSQFGPVKSVSMNMDSATGKHRGFGFVEYEFPEPAEIALELMNGGEFGGRQLKIGRPNNYNPSICNNIAKAPPTRVYVANLSEYISEDMVRSIFESFGPVQDCILIPDRLTRKHKGCGFVQFESEVSAAAAVAAMQGGAFELGGMKLHAIRAIAGAQMPEGMKSLEGLPIPASLPAQLTKVANSIQAAAQTIGGVLLPPSLHSAFQRVQEKVNEESASLEDNFSISASQRYAIMQKLMRNEAESPLLANKAPHATSSNASAAAADVVVPTDSPVVQLKNMVTVAEIDSELNGEVSEECSKYGKVVKVVIWADPARQALATDDAGIFVLFETPEDAAKARQALNGRWFGGKRIGAVSHSLESFNSMTPSINSQP